MRGVCGSFASLRCTQALKISDKTEQFQKTENGSQQEPSTEVCRQHLGKAVRMLWCCNVHAARSSKAVATVLFVEVETGSSLVYAKAVTDPGSLFGSFKLSGFGNCSKRAIMGIWGEFVAKCTVPAAPCRACPAGLVSEPCSIPFNCIFAKARVRHLPVCKECEHVEAAVSVQHCHKL